MDADNLQFSQHADVLARGIHHLGLGRGSGHLLNAADWLFAASSTVSVDCIRQIPREFAYHVELTPAEVLARVETAPDVQRIAGFPARGRGDRKFLVERAGRGFRVCQNLANNGAVDTGPAVLRRLTLEAELVATPPTCPLRPPRRYPASPPR